MAAELRWILLGLSLPVLAGIWWWTARRSGQSPGNAELRESTAGRPPESAPILDPRYADFGDDRGLDGALDGGRDSDGRNFSRDPVHEAGYTGHEAGYTGHEAGYTAHEAGYTARDAGHTGDDGSYTGRDARDTDRDARDTDRDALDTDRDPGHRGRDAGDVGRDERDTGGDAGDRGHERDTGHDIRAQPKSREWGVPPFEPLNIRTADFDDVPILDGPMMVHADPLPTRPEPGGRTAAAAPPAANGTDLQRIVTVRVCAVGEARWSGVRLMEALETHGLAFGRYQVFHRKHTDGRSLFCVASLIEPGTFDVAEMADQEYRGITLFAVLPGPLAPLDTVDELFGTARGLAEELSGMMQDGKGMPLSPQRAAALREDIARFQASLP